ncbi:MULTISPECIES: hypothetical protein [Flammeovirga]|uniref:Uncharacterized protein n=1 Tax=Flammeovirga agarivorans TaxID=2726742 RepID=A0A7X8XZC4_9BACT|nr:MULTISPECIES: hypothetical protein [Flammeovirga]NLR95056.1 hypothetical protein [Flammeovirga agarivorans]
MTEQEIFLRGIWKIIPDEENTDWIENLSKEEFDDSPLGDFGSIIKGMLDKGVEAKSIARLFKIIGYETAFSILYHLEDPIASFEGFESENDHLDWALFTIDEESETPKEGLWDLHSNLLSMDPSGREMRPKKE